MMLTQQELKQIELRSWGQVWQDDFEKLAEHIQELMKIIKQLEIQATGI